MYLLIDPADEDAVSAILHNRFGVTATPFTMSGYTVFRVNARDSDLKDILQNLKNAKINYRTA